MSCFGVEITEESLKATAKYKDKKITQEDKAREAMRSIHSEDRNMEALNHVLKQKSEYGEGVCTLCLLYNATGETLELVDKKDWSGFVSKEEPPKTFANGQWLAFLHVHPTSQDRGCEAARVYRGKNSKGTARDFLVAWCTPREVANQNTAYTEVKGKGFFADNWEFVREKKLATAKKITKDETDECCISVVSIGGTLSPEFIAILKHKFKPLP